MKRLIKRYLKKLGVVFQKDLSKGSIISDPGIPANELAKRWVKGMVFSTPESEERS